MRLVLTPTVMQLRHGVPGPGVPIGGTTGQLLAKASAANYDTQWLSQSALAIGASQVSGTLQPSQGALGLVPALAQALHFVRVNSAGTGYEYRSATQVLADIGAAPLAHTHNAADITSGTFADARIAQSSVVQHQSALSIAWSQLTGVPSSFPPSTHTHPLSDLQQSGASTGQVARWSGSAWAPHTLTAADIGAAPATHAHDASDTTTGVFAAARLGGGTPSSSVYLRGDSTWSGVAWSHLTGVPSSFPPSAHTHDASDIVSGTLATARGGTGLSSFTANRLLWASSTSALSTGGSHWTDGSSLAIGATALAGSERLRVVGGAAPTAATTHDEVRVGDGVLGYTRRIAYIGPMMSVTATSGTEVFAEFEHTLDLAAATDSAVTHRAAHAIVRLRGPAASVAYTNTQFGLVAAAMRGDPSSSAPAGSPGTVAELRGLHVGAGHHWGVLGTTTRATCLHVLAEHRSGAVDTMHAIRLLRTGSAAITTAFGIRDETGWPWAVGGRVALGSASLALSASDERLRVIGGSAPGTPAATEVRIGAGIVRAGTQLRCDGNGSAADPAVRVGSDANGLGLYRSAANELSITANGAQAVVVAQQWLRLPTAASDPTGAPAGAVYFNTATNAVRAFNGTTWITL